MEVDSCYVRSGGVFLLAAVELTAQLRCVGRSSFVPFYSLALFLSSSLASRASLLYFFPKSHARWHKQITKNTQKLDKFLETSAVSATTLDMMQIAQTSQGKGAAHIV